MQLRDLRAMVEEFAYLPDDTLILLASDGEGNHIRHVDCVNIEHYWEYADDYDLEIVHPDDVEGGEAVGLVFWP